MGLPKKGKEAGKGEEKDGIDLLSQEDLRELGLNLRQLKAVQHVKEKGTITNAEYRQLGEVSNKTAYQELSELVQKELFVMKGKGRGAMYLLRGNDSSND